MNMISTGAFLNEMDASSKQTAAEKFAAVWEKKNAKAARAGGVSLMALSLAACGGSSTTTTTTTPVVDAPTAQLVAATTGVDTVVGGEAADTFNAGLSATSMTLGSLDTFDGKGGSDILNIAVNGNVTPGAVTNIETINVTASAATDLNMANVSGFTTLNDVGSTAVVSYSNIESATVALSISDSAVGAEFAYKATALTGDEDTVNVTVANVSAGSVVLTGAIETVNLTSSVAASSFVLDTDATTLNLLGSSDLTLGATSTGLNLTTVVDASAATGKVTLAHDHTTAAQGVTITGGSGNDSLTLTGTNTATDSVAGGAGDDTIIFAADLADADTVDGGDGEDTLTGLSANLSALTTANKVTGIEAITVSDAHDTALTLATISSDIDTVTLAAGAAASNGLTFGAGSATLNLGTDNTATMVVNDTGTGVADTLTINALKADDSFSAENVTINGFETVNINVTAVDADNTVGVFTIVGDPDADGVQTAATVNISGAGDFVFDTSDEFNIGAATGAGVIDASGLTGVFTMTDAAVGVRTITGGSGNDTIVSDNQENTLTGGAGDDNITGGTSADTISGGAGADTINGSTAAIGKFDTVSGGAGIDTFVYTDAQFDAAVTISGDDGVDIVSFADNSAVLDAQYTLKSSIETVTSAATGLTTTLDANAMAAGVETVTFAGTADSGIDDALTVTAGFTSALTVNLDALETTTTNEDNNSVNAAAYTGVLTVNETSGGTDLGVQDASGDLVITGGTGTSDTFNFKGATIQASAIDEITAIENFVVSDDTSTDITLANANTADGKSLSVDGRAITTTSNTLAVDASAEADGAITVHGSAGVDTLTGSQSDMGDTLNGYGGADNFVFAADNLTTLDTVDGGAGTDTVKIATGTTVDADFTNVSNVEALQFTGATTATLGTAYSNSGSVAVTITTGTNSLTMDAVTTAQTVTSSTGGDTIDASDMTAALTMKVTEDGLQANADTITAGTGVSDVLEITFDGLAIAIDAVTATHLANVTGFETIKSASNAIAGLTTNDANVASSKSLTIDMTANASTLATVSIAAETNGAITYLGGAGGNTVTMSQSSMGDTITGAAGNDALTVAIAQLTSADTINGVSGTDTLTFSDAGVLADADLANVSNMDSITLADGTNTIVLGAEYTEAGFATVTTAGTGADSITLGAGVTGAQTVALVGTGTGGNDVVDATSASGAVTITIAEDLLTAGDTLTGGTGSDILSITFDGDVAIDVITAAEMANVTKIETIKSATDAVGSLALSDANTASGVIAVDVSANTAAAFTLDASAEDDGTITYTGGAGVDTVTGTDTTATGDTISLGAGADVYNSTLGSDTITGGAGADVFTYSAVADSTGTAKDSITDFTSGTDFISVVINNTTNTSGQTYDATIQTAAAGTSAVQASMSGAIGQTIFDTTNNVMVVNSGGDNLVTTLDYQIGLNAAATAANTVAEGDVRYVITGGSGIDTIVTGGGDDNITGGGGNDIITSGAGADTITGGAGDDTYTGGAGADDISAGSGTDTIVYTTHTETLNGTTTPDVTAAGGVSTLTGIDIYREFAAGDKIDMSGYTGFTGADATTADGTTELAAATDGGVAIINGNFVEATSKFTEDGTFASTTADDYLIQFADGTNIISFLLLDVAAEIDSLVGSGEIYTLTT